MSSMRIKVMHVWRNNNNSNNNSNSNMQDACSNKNNELPLNAAKFIVVNSFFFWLHIWVEASEVTSKCPQLIYWQSVFSLTSYKNNQALNFMLRTEMKGNRNGSKFCWLHNKRGHVYALERGKLFIELLSVIAAWCFYV